MPRDPFQSQLDALHPEGVRVDALLRFRDDLLRFNRGRNLVSREGGARLVESLILECSVAPRVLELQSTQRILDLGTGAGFPGIPFALSRKTPVPMVLLDRRPVACDFLRREIAELGLEGVEVLEGQSKELLRRRDDLAESFDWVLMKAVAPPVDALALGRPFLGAAGAVVLFRDRAYEPAPELLHPPGKGSPAWAWLDPLPLPGFPVLPESPALQVFQKLD